MESELSPPGGPSQSPFHHLGAGTKCKATVFIEGKREQAAQEEVNEASGMAGPAVTASKSAPLPRAGREVALQAESGAQTPSPEQGSM